MPLRQDDLEYFRRFVLERAAISLESGQDYLIETRLLPLAREENLPDVAALLTRLRNRNDLDLGRRVVEAMTTNETSFFRDDHPFEALRGTILPEVIRRRAADKRLTIWCAACSSGQEPYSLLMMLLDDFPELRLGGWRVRLMASDFSTAMVTRGRNGAFNSIEVARGLSATTLVRHFERSGTEWRVKEPLRKAIEWFPMNLAAPWIPLPAMDVVLMRNVLIYFTPETRAAIFARLMRVLAPQAYLLLGATETTHGLAPGLVQENVGRTVLYRPAAPPGTAGAIAS